MLHTTPFMLFFHYTHQEFHRRYMSFLYSTSLKIIKFLCSALFPKSCNQLRQVFKMREHRQDCDGRNKFFARKVKKCFSTFSFYVELLCVQCATKFDTTPTIKTGWQSPQLYCNYIIPLILDALPSSGLVSSLLIKTLLFSFREY